jgi:lipoprotein NlpI
MCSASLLSLDAMPHQRFKPLFDSMRTTLLKAILVAASLGVVPTAGIAQSNSVDYFNRGVAEKANGDLEGAIADYNRAIELDPKFGAAYSNRGNAKQAKGDLDGAIADCDRAIELDPKDATAHKYRGVAKKAKGDLEGAIADYNRAIELDPKFAAAYFHRGIAKQAKGDLKGAIGDINGAIERNNQDFYPRLFLWLMRSRLGESDAANKELAAFLDRRRDATPEEWTSKVATYLLGNVSEADLFAAAKSSDAKKERGLFCEAWFFAGMKKLLGGDKAAAADYFRKCIATERTDFVEYQLAQSELKALTK